MFYESLKETLDSFSEEHLVISVERQHLVTLMDEYKKIALENDNLKKQLKERF